MDWESGEIPLEGEKRVEELYRRTDELYKLYQLSLERNKYWKKFFEDDNKRRNCMDVILILFSIIALGIMFVMLFYVIIASNH